jgi:hypothetical protein
MRADLLRHACTFEQEKRSPMEVHGFSLSLHCLCIIAPTSLNWSQGELRYVVLVTMIYLVYFVLAQCSAKKNDAFHALRRPFTIQCVVLVTTLMSTRYFASVAGTDDGHSLAEGQRLTYHASERTFEVWAAKLWSVLVLRSTRRRSTSSSRTRQVDYSHDTTASLPSVPPLIFSTRFTLLAAIWRLLFSRPRQNDIFRWRKVTQYKEKISPSNCK